MVNTSLSNSSFTKNISGFGAFEFEPRHALAQIVCTGTFRNTFYTTKEMQLASVLELAKQCDPEFVAKCAIYAREKGFMKEMPAFLCAYLSSIGRADLVSRIFSRVIDSIKMLKNYVKIMRSGTVGRKSLGSNPKRLVQNWLTSKTDSELFRNSIGNDPSLADVIKMTHPKPLTPERENLYRYLIGKDFDVSKLPVEVQGFEAFKKNTEGHTPKIPFEMLTSLSLKKEHWKDIARQASWTQTRMNLNTFMRHEVYEDPELVELVAQKLSNPELIKKSKAFPYQLLAAYVNADAGLPTQIRVALQEAAEISTQNIPEFLGQVYVFPDASGSMRSSVTGRDPEGRKAPSKVQCIDVAALVSAAIVRRNPTAKIIPFGTGVVNVNINPKKKILDIANDLRRINAGGTRCAAPLEYLNKINANGDVFIYISDYESNIGGHYQTTGTLAAWEKLRLRNPEAKMICIDVTPHNTSQAPDREDILNVGGFGDEIFSVIKSFSMSQGSKFWIDVIEKIEI